jgi:two-component system response regulator HydG
MDAARSVLAQRPADAVILLGPELDIAPALEQIFQVDPETSAVIVTDDPSMDEAVKALHAGASDYVGAHEGFDAIVAAIDRIVERQRLKRRLKALRDAISPQETDAPQLIGESPRVRALREQLDHLARSDATVLIEGESGSGKDLAARVLHDASARSAAPMVSVACAALPHHLVESELFGHAKGAFTGAHAARRGLLEQASGGTLLLDDVAHLPLAIQAKLLRALQERMVRPLGGAREVPIDVRIVASTSVPLSTLVQQGRFRGDLYYRLNVLSVEVPPLRERGDDVLVVAQHFLGRMATTIEKRVVGVTPGAARVLERHDWPGNVRELRNWMEAAVVQARFDHVTEHDLPISEPVASSPPDASEVLPLQTVEKNHIVDVLRDTGGNKSRAARILGLDRKTLYRKVRAYGIDSAQSDSIATGSKRRA